MREVTQDNLQYMPRDRATLIMALLYDSHNITTKREANTMFSGFSYSSNVGLQCSPNTETNAQYCLLKFRASKKKTENLGQRAIFAL